MTLAFASADYVRSGCEELKTLGQLHGFGSKCYANFVHRIKVVCDIHEQGSLNGSDTSVVVLLNIPQPSSLGKKFISKFTWIPKFVAAFYSLAAVLLEG